MPTTVINKFVTSQPKVAFTIDDGPYVNTTTKIKSTAAVLDELKKRGVRCTFFMIGWLTDRTFGESYAAQPEPPIEVLNRVLTEGHEVCNHTYHHPKDYPFPPDPCSRLYMPDLPPRTLLSSWEMTIKFFSTAVWNRQGRPLAAPTSGFRENDDYWRSPHFAGTDPLDPKLRSRVRPLTEQVMVDFIFDECGSRRPVAATAGLYIVGTFQKRATDRQILNALMKPNVQTARGAIILAHYTLDDFDRIRLLAVFAKRVGLTLTTVGDVASGQ